MFSVKWNAFVDNNHDRIVFCLFQKPPLVLLLHSLSDNEGDWSILPLLPQWVSLNSCGKKKPTFFPQILFSGGFSLWPWGHAWLRGPPAKCDWLLHAALEGLSDVSVAENGVCVCVGAGGVNRCNSGGLHCGNKLSPESPTLLAPRKIKLSLRQGFYKMRRIPYVTFNHPGRHQCNSVQSSFLFLFFVLSKRQMFAWEAFCLAASGEICGCLNLTGSGGPGRFDPDPGSLLLPTFRTHSFYHPTLTAIFLLNFFSHFQFTPLHHLLPQLVAFFREELLLDRVPGGGDEREGDEARSSPREIWQEQGTYESSRRPPSVVIALLRRQPSHAQLIKPSSSAGLRQLSHFKLSADWIQSVWQFQRNGLFAHPWNHFSY